MIKIFDSVPGYEFCPIDLNLKSKTIKRSILRKKHYMKPYGLTRRDASFAYYDAEKWCLKYNNWKSLTRKLHKRRPKKRERQIGHRVVGLL